MFSARVEFIHSTSLSLWLHGELHKLLDDTTGHEPRVAAGCPHPALQSLERSAGRTGWNLPVVVSVMTVSG